MSSFHASPWLGIVAFLCTALSYFANAEESIAKYLEWQLPIGGQGSSSVSVRVGTGKQPVQVLSFTGEVTISGQIGQSFIVCAKRLSNQSFFQDASAVVPETSSGSGQRANLYVLTLIGTMGKLTIAQGQPCPEHFRLQYPVVSEQHIRSEKNFFAVSKRTAQTQDNQDSGAITPASFAIIPRSLAGLSGGGYDADDHNDFKRPPFMAMPDKAMANLILLPTLNLPADWREQLPFTGLYHWLTNTGHAGVTILVRFDNMPVVTFRISQAETRELAENLLNARQLLCWLAPRLNGREQLIQQLLESLADSGEQSGPFSEETLKSIREQLAIILEQSDAEFSLVFEYSELIRTAKAQNKAQQFPAIFQLGGVQSTASQSFAAGEGTGKKSQKSQSSSSAKGQDESNSKKNLQRLYSAFDQQDSETGFEESSNTPAHYTIKIHQTEYRINRQQVLAHLDAPLVQTGLRLFCQDCQQEGISVQEMVNHAESHYYRGASSPSPTVDEELTLLRFMFRFGTEETLIDLLQQPNLPITKVTLQQTDQYQRTLLHDLAQHTPESVIKAFVQRFKKQIEPDVLQAQDCYGYTPRHYLFSAHSKDLIEALSEHFNGGLSSQPECLTNEQEGSGYEEVSDRFPVPEFAMSLSLLPDDLLGMVFKQLPPESQRALSATCRRLNNYYLENADSLFLKPLVHRYFSHWSEAAVHKAKRWLSGLQGTYRRRLLEACPPGYLIQASTKNPLYPLALLQHALNKKYVASQVEYYLPGGEQFKGSAMVALPNGHLATNQSNTCTVMIWHIDSGLCKTLKPEGNADCGKVLCLAVLADGQLAVSYEGGAIGVWNIEKGTHHPMQESHKAFVRSLAGMTDGTLVSGAKTIKIWDTVTGVCTTTLEGHRFPIVSLAELPANQLASGAVGGVIKIWDIEKEHCICTLATHGHTLLTGAKLTVINRRCLVSVTKSEIKFWDTESKKCFYSNSFRADFEPIALKSLPDDRLVLLSARGLTLFDFGRFTDLEPSIFRKGCQSVIDALCHNYNLGGYYGARKSTMAVLPDGSVAIGETNDREHSYIQVLQTCCPKDVYYDLRSREFLHKELRCGRTDGFALSALFKSGDPNQQNPRDGLSTPLIIASLYGKHDLVERLLQHPDIKVDKSDRLNNTPLMVAAENGHEKSVLHLLQCGANLELSNSDGMTPLKLAIKNGHSRVISVLLEKLFQQGFAAPDDLDVNQTGKEGISLLIASAQRNDVGVVRFCLEQGALVDQCTDDRSTALMLAASSGHIEVARILLEHGARVDLRNACGNTALHIAINSGHPEIEDILEQYGANKCAAYQELMDREMAEEMTFLELLESLKEN